MKDSLQSLCKKAPLSSMLLLFHDTLPESVLTVRPVDDADSGSSPIEEWMGDVPHLRKASASVNRRLKELKILLKGDPTQPNELDGRIEENLASVVQMKDLFSSLEPRKKRLWNDLLGEMVNDLSKRSRGRVVAQEVVNPDQEVTSQETSSVDQDMPSQDTDNDWEGGAWGEMDG